MKRIFVFLFVMGVCFGCDDILEDTKVVIVVPPDVAKVHIAVFDSEIHEKNLLTKNVFGASELVVMNVPSGKNRIFLVVAECFSGFADSTEKYGPVNLSPGKTVDISITLVDIDLTSITPIQNYFSPESINSSWTINRWYEQYQLEYCSNNPPSESCYYQIYEGYSNSYIQYFDTVPFGMLWHRVRAYSPIFNIYTDWVEGFSERV